MILIGMFDSPFVRRVAVSLRLLGFEFEHRNWSVGRDFEQIRHYNPLGRVPTLVLDDGDVLIESSAILDDLDQRVGPERALLPARGADRRRALKLMAIASGAAEKAVSQLYERAFRPEDKWHEPWVQRCRGQMLDALAELEKDAAAVEASSWWLGERMSQADITVAAAATFVHEALALDRKLFPALMARVSRCEALPVFREFHQPFFVPAPRA